MALLHLDILWNFQFIFFFVFLKTTEITLYSEIQTFIEWRQKLQSLRHLHKPLSKTFWPSTELSPWKALISTLISGVIITRRAFAESFTSFTTSPVSKSFCRSYERTQKLPRAAEEREERFFSFTLLPIWYGRARFGFDCRPPQAVDCRLVYSGCFFADSAYNGPNWPLIIVVGCFGSKIRNSVCFCYGTPSKVQKTWYNTNE